MTGVENRERMDARRDEREGGRECQWVMKRRRREGVGGVRASEILMSPGLTQARADRRPSDCGCSPSHCVGSRRPGPGGSSHGGPGAGQPVPKAR